MTTTDRIYRKYQTLEDLWQSKIDELPEESHMQAMETAETIRLRGKPWYHCLQRGYLFATKENGAGHE